MSYFGPNLDIREALKSQPEDEGRAWHWRCVPSTGAARLTVCPDYHCFIPVFTFTLAKHVFILVIDQLNVIMMFLELTRVDSLGKTNL